MNILKTIDVYAPGKSETSLPPLYEKHTLAVFHFSLHTLHRPTTPPLTPLFRTNFFPTEEDEEMAAAGEEANREEVEEASREETEEAGGEEEEEEELNDEYREWLGEDGFIRRTVRDTKQFSKKSKSRRSSLMTMIAPNPVRLMQTPHDHNFQPQMQIGEPFRMRLGCGFAAEALEQCVKSMHVGEVARFLLRPDQSLGFVRLELALREQQSLKRTPSPSPSSSCNHHHHHHLDKQHLDKQHLEKQHLERHQQQHSPSAADFSNGVSVEGVPATLLIPHRILHDISSKPLELHIELIDAIQPSPYALASPISSSAPNTSTFFPPSSASSTSSTTPGPVEDDPFDVKLRYRLLIKDPSDILIHVPRRVRYIHTEHCLVLSQRLLNSPSFSAIELAIEYLVAGLLWLDGSFIGGGEEGQDGLEERLEKAWLRINCRLGLAQCAFLEKEYRKCRAYCDLILAEPPPPTTSKDATTAQVQSRVNQSRGEAYFWRAKSLIAVGMELNLARRDLDLARKNGGVDGAKLNELERLCKLQEKEELVRMKSWCALPINDNNSSSYSLFITFPHYFLLYALHLLLLLLP